VQSGQLLSVAARAEGEEVGEKSPGREGQREPEAARNARTTLPHEIDRQQWQDEQTGVAEVERLFPSVDPKTLTACRHLDGATPLADTARP